MPAGICSDCGCTEEKPCEGGCSWTNETRTLCSRCGLARANSAAEALLDGEELTPALAAMQLGNAIATLQCALYVFEESCGDILSREEFDAVYGDAVRLFSEVTTGALGLLRHFPEAADVARSAEKRIIVP